MDFNEVVDEFATIVARKIIELQGGEPREITLSPEAKSFYEVVEEFQKNTETDEFQKNIEVANNAENAFEPEVAHEPAKVGVAKDSESERKAALNKKTVRELRKLLADAEGKDVSDYGHLNKAAVLKDILALELLVGKHIEDVQPLVDEDVPDDTEVDPEPDDDDEETELDREGAIALGADDLGALKAFAIDNGVDPADLEGLDVHSVVNLLYGDEADEAIAEAGGTMPDDDDQAAESDEEEGEEELDLDDLPNQSIGVLKALADGYDIPYPRGISQSALAELLQERLADQVEA